MVVVRGALIVQVPERLTDPGILCASSNPEPSLGPQEPATPLGFREPLI